MIYGSMSKRRILAEYVACIAESNVLNVIVCCIESAFASTLVTKWSTCRWLSNKRLCTRMAYGRFSILEDGYLCFQNQYWLSTIPCLEIVCIFRSTLMGTFKSEAIRMEVCTDGSKLNLSSKKICLFIFYFRKLFIFFF